MTENQTRAIRQILDRTMAHLNTTAIDYSIEEVNDLVVMNINNTLYKIKRDGETTKI
jgi:hypothetical protein